MKNMLIDIINKMIDDQPEKESDCSYDDHGGYYNEGFYEGYTEALAEVLEIIKNN